jgi:hypothetical protein
MCAANTLSTKRSKINGLLTGARRSTTRVCESAGTRRWNAPNRPNSSQKSQANQHDIATPLSALFRDPFVADTVRRAEADLPPAAALVEPGRPEPALNGTNAAPIPEIA